jgi:hypothetical protein
MNSFFLYRHAWRSNEAPHLESRISKEECKNLLSQGGFLVRNTFDFDTAVPTSFWYIIKDHFEGLNELSSNTRRKVRKALSSYEYKKVGKSVLLQSAYSDIVKPVYAAYRVKDRSISEQWFHHHIDQDERDYDFWACYEKKTGRLVGFADVHRWFDTCEYRLICVHPDCWHNATYPYYGLIFTLNQYYLETLKMKYVTDGARSITEHSNIQDFLIQNFKFRKAYCKLYVCYTWWMNPIVNLLFPFRKVIYLPQIKAILNMEAMRRGEK